MTETRTSGAVILFDIDGTIMRGAGFQHRDSLLGAVSEATGNSCTFDGIDTAGRLDRDLIAALLAKCGVSHEDAHPQVDAIARRACELFQSFEIDDLSRFVLPGVSEFLERAASGNIALAVVSGNLRTIGLRKLERAGVGHFFPIHAFSEDGHTRAELARLAADEALASSGLDEWAPIYLIGDHLNDIEAARLNGFYSIAVATGVLAIDQLRSSEPTLAVPNLTELRPTDLLSLHRS